MKTVSNCNFQATILRFKDNADKTNWTYLLIPSAEAGLIHPQDKKMFRISGKLDGVTINKLSLLPAGNGDYLLPLNAGIRKALAKPVGAKVDVSIYADTVPPSLNAELLECLEDEPEAKMFFESLAPSHRLYFSKWIDSARTIETKTRRITYTILALSKRWDYGTMIRSLKGAGST